MVIFESKLCIPNYSPYLIRNRLFSFLDDHLDRSLICLTSDGGYGKTTLISSFIKERKIPSIWYQLSPQDRSAHTFLAYMKTAISRELPPEKIVFESQAEILEPELFEQEVDKVIAFLSTWPTRLLIILDNYQSIHQSEEVEEILTKMIFLASPFITFIITSRLRPNLQLVKLKLQNRLAELKTKDLIFTKDEILQFFVDLHQLTIQDQEVDLIFHKTEGWIASLQLLQDLIKDMPDADRSSFWDKFSGTPDIYDYLGTEILVSESEEVQSFLYKTCLLSDLNANIINKYLGIKNAEGILDYLLKNHLFIYKTELGIFKYHILFRSFLYKELSKRYTKDEINDYHRKLFSVYEETSDLFNAFAHSVAGNDFLVAAELMRTMKELYPPSHFMVLIDGWLENISPELSSANVSLFIIRCIPLEIVKDLIAMLEVNIKNMNEKTSQCLLTHLKHQLAAMYFYSGDIHKANQLCSESLAGSKKMKDQELISINLSLQSLIYSYMEKYDEALLSAQESLSYPDPNGNFHPHHLALWILAEIKLEQNDLWKAESLLKETLKLSEQRYDSSIIYPYCSLGKLYRLMGRYDEALHWIKKAEELTLKFNVGYDLGWINKELASTYFDMKHWEETEYHLSAASNYLTHAVYLKAKVKQMQIHLWREQGKSQLAAETQQELDDICREMNYDWLAPNHMEPQPEKLLIQANASTATKLSISTLGNFTIKYRDQIITLKRKSSLRLLQYLIAHRESRLIKESIIDEIFPEGSLKAVNSQFYVALSYLRKTLEPDLKSGRDSLFIQQSGEQYFLCRKHLHLDIDEFTQLIQKKGKSASSDRISNLKRAEALYQGDYFEEYPYIPSLELERERLRMLYLSAMQELAYYHWENSDYESGMEYYERMLKKEPYQESIYEDYIKRLLGANLILHAKKVSELYLKYIEKELGIPVQNKLHAIFNQYS